MDKVTKSNEPVKADGNLEAVGHETTFLTAQEDVRESSASQKSDISDKSEVSGVSKLAERVGDLKVQTTGFVQMDGPTIRAQGLSRKAALVVAAQTAREERENAKLP